jgi:hypothetical protein
MSEHEDIKAFGVWRVTTEGDCEGRTTCSPRVPTDRPRPPRPIG